MINLHVSIDDFEDEMNELSSLNHIQEEILQHLREEKGGVIIEMRFTNAPTEERFRFSNEKDFKSFVEESYAN